MGNEQVRGQSEYGVVGLSEKTAEEIRAKSDRCFWEYQIYLVLLGAVKRTGTEADIEYMEGYNRRIFEKMHRIAAEAIEGVPETLQIPEFRRFAEYFGALPAQDDVQYPDSQDRDIPAHKEE